jgi:hypothetical protein
LAPLKKHHADPELFRQCNPIIPNDPAEKSLRKREQQACPIATTAVSVHAAAMGQARQSLETALHHAMRRGSAQLRDEAHAAGIMIARKGEATLRHVRCLT